jgi:hypothetical protein
MKNSFPGHKMNAPVGHTDSGISTATPTQDASFVCRGNAKTTPTTTLNAGQNIAMQWTFTADHPGDCAVYISYDIDLPAKDQRFFKIASLPKCKDNENTDVQVMIPSWLPASSHAILRWDWYGLHVRPNIEFYTQCVDVIIKSNNALEANNLPKPNFKIPGLFPPNANSGNTFRNAFTPSITCEDSALSGYPNVHCQADGSTGANLATYTPGAGGGQGGGTDPADPGKGDNGGDADDDKTPAVDMKNKTFTDSDKDKNGCLSFGEYQVAITEYQAGYENKMVMYALIGCVCGVASALFGVSLVWFCFFRDSTASRRKSLGSREVPMRELPVLNVA